jgi:hypothetical protein
MLAAQITMSAAEPAITGGLVHSTSPLAPFAAS